ncbi:TetR/AcrR family transcriptional regulator [Halorubellus sp. JP-L1]|uniref:TetR/AcrR family transcriptional regulator n=1 Tax=Halorubellus sp. JP-L1 TaxID=2715753 RepID=UPI001408BE55|nr:TetR/AcrR family transcriptional regulator [Halorubellus sp. JP-L1]NHN42134.1 TetR/AcrR family transcriptional regulator [Halorubellus sp. JP-L1]
MSETESAAARSEAVQQIMRGTYEALCERGYADLRMVDIADRTDLSKSTLHYHFDSKHDLLLAFLEYLYEDFERELAAIAGDDPGERLRELVRTAYHDDDDGREELRVAILEIEAQAPYDDAFRDRLRRFDRLLHDVVRSNVEEGKETGRFRRDVDADAVATFVATALTGAHNRRVSLGVDTSDVETMLLDYLDERLVEDGSD